MPVFEFRCLGCETDFERLVFSQNPKVACPACGGSEIKRKPSVFGMSGVEKQVSSGSSCSGCSASSCAGCGSN